MAWTEIAAAHVCSDKQELGIEFARRMRKLAAQHRLRQIKAELRAGGAARPH